MIYIDDNNAHEFMDVQVDGEWKGRGHIPRDYQKVPYGSVAAPFDIPVIPRSEWDARRKQLEDSKSRISDVVKAVGMKSLDQGRTNFCWANGPVNCVRVIRCINNQPFVDLSPASVACPINGFRNEGGWGTEALKRIVSHGVTEARLWPANAIDRQYFTEEAKQNALNYRVSEWYELQPRNLEQLVTCCLLRIPVAIGLNWWRHEVMACDLVENGVLIWNSWGDSWGDGGFGVLSFSKATPDDAVAPRVVLAAA